jgi:desulfoferrodoxin (superoxide reductase-like protein)
MIIPVVQVLAAFTLWTSLASAQDDAVVDNGDVHCLTVHEDLMRRQKDEWGSEGPYIIDDGTKHTPFISFNASTRQATVIVGNGDDTGGVYHPMLASDNPATVHFITHIYVVDQHNDVFAFSTLDPNEEGPATFAFTVPQSVTQMMAFEFWYSTVISAHIMRSAQVMLLLVFLTLSFFSYAQQFARSLVRANRVNACRKHHRYGGRKGDRRRYCRSCQNVRGGVASSGCFRFLCSRFCTSTIPSSL